MKRSTERWARGAACALSIGAALGSAGCAPTKLIGRGPFNEVSVKSARKSAVRYFLAKDILLVDADIKLSRITTLRAENDGAGHFTFGTRTRVKFDSSSAKIAPKTVPDTSAFFQIELENGDSSEDNVTVEVTDQGLLKSVNATASSQAGEIVKNVAQVAASVAAVAGALGGRDPGIVNQVHGLFDKDAQSTLKLKESLAALPLEVLYLLHEAPDARALWARKLRLEALLVKRGGERTLVEDAAVNVKKADLDTLKQKLGLLDASIQRAREERQGVIDLLEAALAQLKKEKHLGAEPLSRTLAVAFELEEVPGDGTLSPGMDPVEVKARLLAGNFPKMAQLFEDAGVVFTLALPRFSADDPNAVPKPSAVTEPDPPGESEGRFFFRQSYPAVLRSFAKATLPAQPVLAPTSAHATTPPMDVEVKNKGGHAPPAPTPAIEELGEREQIRVVEDRVVDLIPASAPELYIAFSPKDFATRKLALSFDEKGRLARLERSGTSALAGETGALAEGVVKAREAYATTLKKLVDIQDTARTLSLDRVQGQIDKVQKQKELLDARSSLEGSQATSDIVLQKQRLDAELAALQSRAAFESARDALQQNAEIEKLKAELDRLTAELAALKARTDTGSGNGSGSGTGSGPPTGTTGR